MKIFPSKLDVVPEYTGSIVEFLNGTYNGSNAKPITVSDPQKTIDKAKPLLDKAGITLLHPSTATDTNAFFVTKKYSDQNNVHTLSDLKGKSVTLAAAPDCKGRLDCEGGLSSAYGIDITKILPLGYASQQTYDSVLKGESELGETSTTDGTLQSQGLVLLADDQHIQPARFMFESGNTGDKLMVMLKKRGLGNVFACYEGRAYENLACFSRVEVAVVNTPLRYYCQTIQGHPLECRYLR